MKLRTRVVIDNMFIYHFVDPDLRLEAFFEKDGGEKFHAEVVCFLIVFCRQKIAFKSSLNFHPSIIISESRKRHTLRLLLMCLEALEEGFSCFPGRD